MKYFHQLATFNHIWKAYEGGEPLSRFLSSYFRAHKQMGSKDRKYASRYIYAYFRLGKALIAEPLEVRLAVADFLVNEGSSPVSEEYLKFENALYDLPLAEKIAHIEAVFPQFSLEDVFYHSATLSGTFSKKELSKRLFRQPDLFIRVAKNKLEKVSSALQKHQIPFEKLGETCLSLPNGSKLENILLPQDYQVQDYASQQTGAYFKPNDWEYWWDCCAASGGKSLLLHSICPTVKILASDNRAQSLENLKHRFIQAGLQKFQYKTLNMLENNKALLTDYAFDGIIVDAPCTGSGTWARNPEQHYYFEDAKIEQYAALQKQITSNALPYLKAGKPLIYITCSVFKAENEDVVQHLLQKHPQLKLESMQLIDGSANNADNMFVARMIFNG